MHHIRFCSRTDIPCKDGKQWSVPSQAEIPAESEEGTGGSENNRLRKEKNNCQYTWKHF